MSTYRFHFCIILCVLDGVDVRKEQLAEFFVVLGGAAKMSAADSAACSSVASESPYLSNKELKNSGQQHCNIFGVRIQNKNHTADLNRTRCMLANPQVLTIRSR